MILDHSKTFTYSAVTVTTSPKMVRFDSTADEKTAKQVVDGVKVKDWGQIMRAQA